MLIVLIGNFVMNGKLQSCTGMKKAEGHTFHAIYNERSYNLRMIELQNHMLIMYVILNTISKNTNGLTGWNTLNKYS
jgi:hypothetical protein